MIQILTAILLFVVSYVFWVVYQNCNSGTSKVNLPPGSFGWPFLGETLALLRASRDGVPERFVQERIKKHGSPLVFKTSLFGDRMAVFCGPAGNKFLFGNENKLVAAWWPLQVRKLFGKCLITIRGDEAKWMRKMLLSYLGPDAFASHYAATSLVSFPLASCDGSLMVKDMFKSQLHVSCLHITCSLVEDTRSRLVLEIVF